MASMASPESGHIVFPFRDPIVDYNSRQLRRQGLARIDEASFSRRHCLTVLVSGIVLFTAAYDLLSSTLFLTCLALCSCPMELFHSANLAMKMTTSVGTVIGQFLCGCLADRVGRKSMSVILSILLILLTLLQTLADSSPAVSILDILVLWRMLMGIPVGGAYPISPVIAAE